MCEYVFKSPVGASALNPFGLYDMHGNARQWCADWFDPERAGDRSAIVPDLVKGAFVVAARHGRSLSAASIIAPRRYEP